MKIGARGNLLRLLCMGLSLLACARALSPAAAQVEVPAPQTVLSPPTPPAPLSVQTQPTMAVVDISALTAVTNLGSVLSEGRVRDPQPQGTAWYTVSLQNYSTNAVTRMFIAVESPAAGIALVPPSERTRLREIAATDGDIVVEHATAFGPDAFRITVPPARTATLALHFGGVTGRPNVLAWAEPALIAHNQRSAVLSGMVGGILTAALAFAAGVAVLGRRPFAKWAALLAAALLICDLVLSGAFDDTWLSAIGGPYALFSLALSLTMACGVRLIDHVAPYEAFRPWARLWADRIAIIIVVLGLASYFGVPGIGLFLRFLAVVGAACAAGYLAHCGRLGVAAARRLAPAATIFALITAASSFRAMGFFGINLVAPAAIAGFSSVGAMLVALAAAAAAGEPSVARLRAMRDAHREDDAETTDEALAETRDLAAVASAHQGIFDLDFDSGLISFSQVGANLLAFPAGLTDLDMKALLTRLHPENRSSFASTIADYRRHVGAVFRVEFRGAGDDRWYELRATIRGRAGKAERCLGLIADITSRKLSEQNLSSGESDALTGVGSRHALFARLDAEGAALHTLTLALLDLDRFKSVNASLGRDDGDALLKVLAERLARAFQSARLFRFGGDSFVLLLEPSPELKAANLQAFGNAVVQTMSQPFVIAGRDIYLPVSVGVASGASAKDGRDLLAQAEAAMVAVKRTGGARAHVHVAGDSAHRNADPVALETDLRRALERGEIILHYQPIMRLSDGTLAGLEALLRWAHPEHGVIGPERFIAHAERTGLIVRLGQVALEKAAEELQKWQRDFPSLPPLFVSVNVTWRQIAHDGFFKDLEALLQRQNLLSGTLRLEITESAVMADADAAQTRLARLREMGLGLAVDDFGTGHSSLSHLRRFPFNAVKIDKSFLSRDEKDGPEILSSMIWLAHGLGLEVVAEGVETKAQAERLRALGCEFAQGYFYSAPMPAADVRAFITANKAN